MLLEAFDSNWIAPLGPHVDAFEEELCREVGVGHAAALSSGTAALHLGLLLLDVSPGDEVLTATLTFAATANAISYVGARPVLIDSERSSWDIDPDLVAEELHSAQRRGKLPKALVAVDIYGQCADYGRLRSLCDEYGVPILEDAAEALGARCGDQWAGSLGDLAVVSFNGNKIITASGGGMLLSNRKDWIERARFLATQARDPAPHYQHSHIGYNYRMSNLLAAVGRGQLSHLAARVGARRANNAFYQAALANVEGLSFMPEAPYGRSNGWLTCILVDRAFDAEREQIRQHLESQNIEARPVWKPMHLQPAFADCRRVRGQVAEELFSKGLCLPSGSSLTLADRERVVEALLSTPRRAAAASDRSQ